MATISNFNSNALQTVESSLKSRWGKEAANAIDFAAIKEAAEPHTLGILENMFPDGELRGSRFYMLNPRREDFELGSFSIDVEDGLWGDFADPNGASGGDIISLIAYVYGLDSQAEAARALQRCLEAEGIRLHPKDPSPPGAVASTSSVSARTTRNKDVGTAIVPVPEDAGPMLPMFKGFFEKLGDVQGVWNYTDADGKLVCHIVRIGKAGGKKDFLPATYRHFPDGCSKWTLAGLDGKRPLYNLQELACRPDAEVLVVEGEKAADACKALCPEKVVVTTMNGAKSPEKTDFEPLNGRKVWIWPDADEAGAAYAKKVKEILRKSDPLRQIVVLPPINVRPVSADDGTPSLEPGFQPPKGWDAADAVGEGWTAEHFQLLLERLAKTENTIAETARAELVQEHEPEAEPNVPTAVLGVVQQFFPQGLKYFQQNFYSYQAGHWKMLDEVAQVKKAVAQYYGRSAVAKEVTATTQLLSFLLAESEGFTPHPAKICMLNGTLDTNTYELEPHSPAHSLLNQLRIDWAPEAKCPRWLQFLDETFSPDVDKAEKIAFLQQWFGYCLTPDISQQKFTWLVGAGANGKSVIIKVLTSLVGFDNVSAAKIGDLEKGPVRAELQGKLLNISAEMSADATVADGSLKEIVAGDPIMGERKYQKPFMFTPTVKIMASTNALPRLQDLSHGFARRAVILTFNRIVPEAQMDRDLECKLLQELDGILVWAIDGLKKLREQDRFTLPPSSAHAVVEYRTESDAVALFIQERLMPVETGGTSPTELYRTFKVWAMENGFSTMSSVTFGKRLQGRGFKKKRGHSQDVYPLVLRDDHEEALEAFNGFGGHSEPAAARYRI